MKGLAPLLLAFFIIGSLTLSVSPVATGDPDVVIVGSGIAGLSAALESAERGATILVLEMSSVFGGHAVMSGGAVCIVDTPVQQSQNIQDSPHLAFRDFVEWGEDANQEWVRYYVESSRREIYDWLSGMGVIFSAAIPHDGNSVPRLHMTRGKGLALVSPIYQACLEQARISFRWNTQVEDLLIQDEKVVGVSGQNLRTGAREQFRARAVILATGGFQSNLEQVLNAWPRDEFPVPNRLLIGAGRNATGSGHQMARQAGGVVHNLDHQWNYALGLPDPRDKEGLRGLAVFIPLSIWVNRQGKRFVNEFAGAKETLPAVMAQEGQTYWSIFDADGKSTFKVNLPGWNADRIQAILLDRPRIVRSADTLVELAQEIDIPSDVLTETVAEWNQRVEEGRDSDFNRFTTDTIGKAAKIVRPPFYAVQFYPITRKSMGGVKVDLSCRVLNRNGKPIPGLYAAGEVAGFGGINGKAALEGTFLGPSIVMGRVAGRAVAANLSEPQASHQKSAAPSRRRPLPASAPSENCSRCHDLTSEVTKSRRGFWHFEKSHQTVLDQGYECVTCHSELAPYRPESHQIDPLLEIENCKSCHGAE